MYKQSLLPTTHEDAQVGRVDFTWERLSGPLQTSIYTYTGINDEDKEVEYLKMEITCLPLKTKSQKRAAPVFGWCT